MWLACTGDFEAGGRQGRVHHSLQRGTHIFQILDQETKKAVCQVTDKQVGSEAKAKCAADVLLKIFLMGASKEDMQRVKSSGCLGCVIGKTPA